MPRPGGGRPGGGVPETTPCDSPAPWSNDVSGSLQTESSLSKTNKVP